MSVTVGRVQVEHHRQAIGIGESTPRISWRFIGEERDWIQRAYEIEVTSSTTKTPQFHEVESSNSNFVPWPAQPLQSGESALIRVRAFGNEPGHDTPWSEPVSVEVGLLDRKDWTCSLIAAGKQCDISAPRQPVLFRREFELREAAHKARIYITSQGV